MLLTTQQVRARTGFSQLKVRQLIQCGKLAGIDTGVGGRSYYQVTELALDNFLSGSAPAQSNKAKTTRTINSRIDANVPKVFGH